MIEINQNFILDHKYTSALSFNETLAVVNEKEEEVGEFIGRIRTCNSNTIAESMMINFYSSIFEHGEEKGMSVVTNTTANFHSYEEKWSQWLVSIFKTK